jgi:hypothetical protein
LVVGSRAARRRSRSSASLWNGWAALPVVPGCSTIPRNPISGALDSPEAGTKTRTMNVSTSVRMGTRFKFD